MLKIFSNRPSRTRLSQDSESQDGLLPTSTASPPLKHTASDHSRRDVWIAVRTHVLCTVAYVCATLWMTFHIRRTTPVADPDKFCIHHVSQFSPVVRDVKPNWHTQTFNGSFLHQNIYRQAAGPEVDAAWDALGINYRSVVIAETEAEQTGLRHDQVKVSQEYGGIDTDCLEDLLRKTLHWNYDYCLAQKQGAFLNSEHIVRVHTTHCLDTLRQVLMCNPDVGVLGQVWWQPENEPEPMPFVDFNTRHRCRDYEAIRRWAEAHQLPPETEVDMQRFYEKPKAGDTILREIP
ncbi:hypothetical protein yc1106_07915 [Curvularia clavata]|uniref:Uncharacterized protein n=1 Tax=Curvularia clavata TaxID=95742 RepID=A0A9Q8ZEH0_CURCL|nr:hypothetical protein yc1106_07915 [Curvularia clavata]